MTSAPTLSGARPIVIAHRGASGYRPEHTLEGYRLAIEMGADYIEPDLVITKDGHLVIRHDRYLGMSTNVSSKPEFADRRVIKDSRKEPDWYIEDFTLDEVRTLRARQPFPGRSTDYDDRFAVPTFADVLGLAQQLRAETGRHVGVYPEAKHPAFFAAIGLDYEPLILSALKTHVYTGADSPIYIQSFESALLRSLREQTPVRLIQLLPAADGTVGLEEIRDFANAIGPAKTMLVDKETNASSGLIEEAHALGLEVHPWTFRDDVVGRGFATPQDEIAFFLSLGIDGLFTDFPDTAVSVVATR